MPWPEMQTTIPLMCPKFDIDAGSTVPEVAAVV